MAMRERESDRAGRAGAERPPVVFVPGGVLPAALSYGPVLEVIGREVRPLLKDLDVYAAPEPPAGYSLEREVEALRLAADAARFDTFHLVGYSGGGAVSLAFVAKYPDRVRSLALVEPAWIGNDRQAPEETAYWAEIDRVMTLPPPERMPAFVRANLSPGVTPPPTPPGPPPPWMARRPAGLEAMGRAFKAHDLDRARFRDFRRPVYVALGSLSHPIEERKAEILAGLFPDCRVEVYAGRHHFDPPHRTEPERFVRALRELWARGEAAARSETEERPFIT